MRRMTPIGMHSLHDRSRANLTESTLPRKKKKKKSFNERSASRLFLSSGSGPSSVLRKFNRQLRNVVPDEMSCRKLSEPVGCKEAETEEHELTMLEGCVQRMEAVYGGRGVGGEILRLAAEMKGYIDRLKGYCSRYSYLANSSELKSNPNNPTDPLLTLTHKY